jgi:hypothetical protein
MNRLGLTIQTIWSDSDMLEFRVTAANEAFSGVTEFYVGLDEAARLARSIDGFPRSPTDARENQLGDPEGSDSGGALLAFTSDGSGHVTVEVQLWAVGAHRSQGRVSLRLQSLPGDIDSFVADLLKMRKEVGAQASLRHAI